MQVARIRSIRKLGKRDSIDFEVDHPDHNFYANGLVTSNSHSSAYAYITAITTYLKFKYPLQFFKNALNVARFEQKPQQEISKIIQEFPAFGIRLLPPSLVKKNFDFVIEGGNIRLGLSALKGLSEKAGEHIKDFELMQQDKFSMFEAVSNSGINITVFQALIKAGCFDEFEENRDLLAFQARIWGFLTKREKKLAIEYGDKYDWNLLAIIKDFKEGALLDKGKIIMKESRWGTFFKKYEPIRNEYLAGGENEKMSKFKGEYAVCGFSYSVNLREMFDYESMSIQDGKDSEGNFITIAVLTNIFENISKKGNKYYKIEIEDDTMTTEGMIFKDAEKNIVAKNGNVPEVGDIVAIRGSFNNDYLFVDGMVVLDKI